MLPSPEAIVAAARALIGVPWVHQHASADAVDCGGLLRLVRERLGMPAAIVAPYGRQPDGSMMGALERYADRVARHEAQPGDIAVFDFGQGPQHVGILGDYKGGKLSLIHADMIRGRVVEHRLDAVRALPRARLVAVLRVKG
jgi:cell wall-associated NlpC family hydrolase